MIFINLEVNLKKMNGGINYLKEDVRKNIIKLNNFFIDIFYKRLKEKFMNNLKIITYKMKIKLWQQIIIKIIYKFLKIFLKI